MQRTLVPVILLVVCATPLWAVGAKAADQAVGNAFPAMDANRKMTGTRVRCIADSFGHGMVVSVGGVP